MALARLNVHMVDPQQAQRKLCQLEPIVNSIKKHDFTLASSPGSTQFFNDAHRKTREPGKIYYVRDVRWDLGRHALTCARYALHITYTCVADSGVIP